MWDDVFIQQVWKYGKICRTNKKCEVTICEIYGADTILCAKYKILEKILQAKLLPHVEEIIGGSKEDLKEEDQVLIKFIMRKIIGNIWQQYINIQQPSIGFRAAYDNVLTKKIWCEMHKLCFFLNFLNERTHLCKLCKVVIQKNYVQI